MWSRLRRPLVFVPLAMLVGLLLAAIGWSLWWRPAQAPALPADVAAADHVVVLGDSVTTGSTCHCTPFPDLLSQSLTSRVGHHVAVANDGVDGADTAALLGLLREDEDTRSDVASADIVVVTIGANDLEDVLERAPGQGKPCPASCYGPPARKAARSVGAVIQAVRGSAPSARIVVTNYWNVSTDGATIDPQVRAWNTEVTGVFNESLRQAVGPTGATYVDLVAPFEKATAGDPTPLLLADGDHPSASGHRRIADAILVALGAWA